jgi:bacterial/archaeal transporter family-2 protein
VANQLFYSSLMMATGIGIPIMAALSAGLGSRYGSTAFAACVLFFVALSISLLFLFAVQGGLPQLPKTPVPAHFYLGGIFVAFYVLSITWVAPKFGVGNAVAFVLLGQIVSMAAIDQFGLMGAPVITLSPKRVAGLALMIAGVFLAVRRS